MILVNREHRPSLYSLAVNPQPNERPDSLEWIYDFGSVIGDHHQYWEAREAAATETVSVVEQQIARDIIGEFGSAGIGVRQLLFLESISNYPPPLKAMARHAAEIPEDFNPQIVRREAFGALAVSRFICSVLVPERLFPGRREVTDRARDAIGALASPDFMLDMDADDQGLPRDYRIHLPFNIATNPAIFPSAPAVDAWYFGRGDAGDREVLVQDHLPREDDPNFVRDPSHGNLWLHRTEADLSDGLRLFLQEKGLAPRSDMITFFPYIPDRDRLPHLNIV